MARVRTIARMIFDGRGSPLAPPLQPRPESWSNDEITGSCLGHSTVLLNIFGLRVLTDPVFSTRVGLGFQPLVLGPKRYLRPALRPREFAAPDLILLSHAHFDHLDVASLRRFSRDTPIVTARHTGDLLRRWRFRDIVELDWGAHVSLTTRAGAVRIEAIEVAHWGARLIRDAHRGYNGYVIEREGASLCFAGDTAYTRAFSRLNNPRRPLDLMLMPIGAYNPWIRAHCSPEQAVEMANQAGAKYFVPIHHETFQLSDEPMDEPAARLRAAFVRDPERLLAVSVGETFRIPLRMAA